MKKMDNIFFLVVSKTYYYQIYLAFENPFFAVSHVCNPPIFEFFLKIAKNGTQLCLTGPRNSRPSGRTPSWTAPSDPALGSSQVRE